MQVITERKHENTIPVRDVPPGAVYTYSCGDYLYLKSNTKYSTCLQDGTLVDVSTSTLKVRIVDGVFHVKD